MLALLVLLLSSISASACGPVDVSTSSVAFPNGLVAVAGQPFTAVVELNDFDGEPVCDLFDPLLFASCSGDTASFCLFDPAIKPLGGGRYEVLIVPGAFRGEQGWPPSYSPSNYIPDNYFTGNNTLRITYDDFDLPGGPFSLNLKPAALSTTYTVANMLDPAIGVAGTSFPIARLYQLVDNYGNYIREYNVINDLQVTIQPSTANVTLRWWYNWWIEVNLHTYTSGSYTLQFYHLDTEGAASALKIRSLGAIVHTAAVLVKPSSLSVDDFTVSELPRDVEAGAEFAIQVQSRDQYQNPTLLIHPMEYRPFIQQQANLSLLQVDLLAETNTTSVQKVAGPGQGQYSIRVQAVVAGLLHLNMTYKDEMGMKRMLATGYVSVHPSTATAQWSSVTIPAVAPAGGFDVAIHLADAWGNPTAVYKNLSVSSTELDMNHTIVVIAKEVTGSSTMTFFVPATKLGRYKVDIRIGDQALQLNTVNIVANEASVLTSFVSGYAAGAGVDDNLPSPVVAGRTYTLQITARDVYGNLVDATYDYLHLAVDGPGVTNVTLVHGQSSGILMYGLSFTKAGLYTITVLLQQQVLRSGKLLTLPGSTEPAAALLSSSPPHTAGSQDFEVYFFDAFGNHAAASGALHAAILAYTGEEVLQQLDEVTTSTSVSLYTHITRVGQYSLSFYLNGRLLGQTPFQLNVLPGPPAGLVVNKSDFTAHTYAMHCIVVDQYGNAIQLQQLEAKMLSITLEPRLEWEAMLTADMSGLSVTIWTKHGPTVTPSNRQVYIMYGDHIVYNSTWLVEVFQTAPAKVVYSHWRVLIGNIIFLAIAMACVGVGISMHCSKQQRMRCVTGYY